MLGRNGLYKELLSLKSKGEGELELKVGWWEKNRLLSRGDYGEDVAHLKRSLARVEGATLNTTKRFDEATENAVIEFQRRVHLKPDGKAGPFTQAVLYEGNYRYNISKPPIVKQEIWTCWAAAYESALPSWRGRARVTVTELIEKYKQFLQQNNSISSLGFDAVAKDFNAEVRSAPMSGFTIDVVKDFLLKANAHLIIVTGSTVAHCRVVYGFGVKAGETFLLLMDPLTGDYRRLPIGTIEALGGDITIVRPL